MAIANKKRHIALCVAYVENTPEDDSDPSNIYTVVKDYLEDHGIDVQCSTELLTTTLGFLSTRNLGFALQYGFNDSEVAEDLASAIIKAVSLIGHTVTPSE
jgi:hypothetical protein